MFRPVARALARAPAVAARTPASTRLISTGPTPKSRSFKSTLVRLGLAGGAIYYYNTNSAFSEESTFSVLAHLRKDNSEASTQTLDSITPKIREERAAAQALEDEAGQQAAFNPETGEINWDCPCLGGMAHGPCGEEFKAAFSCFVYSEEETKGIDCIDKFKDMQNCFRQHPEVYGAELEDDEAEGGAPAQDTPAQDALTQDASPEQSAPAVEQQTAPASEEKPAAEESDPLEAIEADIQVPQIAPGAEKTQ